jgi:hypothetical protein
MPEHVPNIDLLKSEYRGSYGISNQLHLLMNHTQSVHQRGPRIAEQI